MDLDENVRHIKVAGMYESVQRGTVGPWRRYALYCVPF